MKILELRQLIKETIEEAFFIGEEDDTIECAKCGWRWELEDGDGNPYLCHKCDYDNNYKYNDNLDEGFAHQMSNSDFDKMTNILNNKSKADQIHSLLIQMFPNQKELLDYNYKNDSYAEFKRFIHGIENYSLEGPINIPYTDLKLDPEVYAERDRKYNDYVEGKINKYFRDTNLDPRKVDLSKVPPITVDENGEVMDGNHRAFLAIKQQKPLKGYRMVAKQNSHPNVAKIKALLNTIDEGLEDTFWINDKNQKITLQQLLDAIKNYPVIQAPIEKVEKIIIKKDTGGIESDRLNAADVKYPIIIVVDDNKNYKYVLDGNHRANKAIAADLKSIPAKLVNIKKLPQEFQDVLGESLYDWFEEENWVRINTAGKITGPCGTMKKGQATTRCLPRAKANSLTKAERAATARKKVAGSKKGKQFVSNTKKAKVKFNK
jgi:hypothetical protein